jgi:hypothetical protein
MACQSITKFGNEFLIHRFFFFKLPAADCINLFITHPPSYTRWPAADYIRGGPSKLREMERSDISLNLFASL